MKEAVAWLFSENTSNLKITLYNEWHIFYLLLTFGLALLMTFLFRNKGQTTKEKVCRIFAYITIGLYVADFFIMPLSDSFNGISEYKLPFNICTAMAVLVPFVQFNKKLEKIKVPVVVLSIAASLMWMIYPGSALGGQPPFSYVIFETFMYHGALFIWGFLNLALNEITLKIKYIWKEFVGIMIILVWAWFGNTIYGDWNWFFIQKSIFPFLSDAIMPVMVVASVFGVCLCVYGLYFLTIWIKNKITSKKAKVKNSDN